MQLDGERVAPGTSQRAGYPSHVDEFEGMPATISRARKWWPCSTAGTPGARRQGDREANVAL